VSKRYLEALDVWERASADPTDHPDYTPLLRQEIWGYLTSLKANKDFVDASAGIRHMAVKREMERESWAYDLSGQTLLFQPVAVQNGHSEDDPNGGKFGMNYHPEQVVSGFTNPMPNGNGHTADANAI
jgi:hypothetical protein